MRTIYTTLELLSLLRSSDREPSPASPFRALMTLNAETEARALTEEQRLLCAFALNPERTILLGRHSAADGTLYLLNIGPIWYLYTWLEAQDRQSAANEIYRNAVGAYRRCMGSDLAMELVPGIVMAEDFEAAKAEALETLWGYRGEEARGWWQARHDSLTALFCGE